ncbi:MAG: hypothetical protein QF662_02325, partial [Phycisphaerae bacterium]|nr:hypothetical protein [Phycisphaerae bacterium]
SEPTRRRTALANGSMVEVLTQSNRSVRGRRVHRLRCDELDEFDPDVWQAAQFVTQSSEGIRARMEVFSTLHRPWGLMQKVVDELAGGALAAERPTSAEATAGKLFKWCLWEVIERCPAERSCSRCPLSPDCGGKARDATGYLQIDDAIAQMRRSSTAAWRSEMLCQRPRSEDLVFAEFQPAVHVSDVAYDAALPLYRAVDFGYANPFVCLWLQVRPASDGMGQEQVRVIGEYVERRRTIAEHLKALRDAEPGPVASTFADPAGWARNDVTGTGPCQELAAMGERVKTRRSGILEGVEIIRRLLAPAACVPGQRPGLVIDRRCPTLIKALETYHFRPVGKTTAGGGRWEGVPEKDGTSDHPIDALRYGLVNLLGTSTRPLKVGKYW